MSANYRSPVVDPRRSFMVASWLSWFITLAALSVVVLVVSTTSLHVQFGEAPGSILLMVGFLPAALVYTYFRYDRHVASLCDGIATLSAFIAVAAPLTYVGTYLGADRPFVDEWLLLVDEAIGFDWMRMLAWANERPAAAMFLEMAYASLPFQTLFVVAVLAVAGQHQRLQIFILAFQFSMIATSLVPAVFPAIGIYQYLGIIQDVHHPAIMLGTMDIHVADVLQLRGSNPTIDYSRMEGIVVVPSFHMVSAVLFTWAFWGVPIIRWFALALNASMAFATPLSGGHYLFDLVAGALLAVAAVAIATALRSLIEGRLAREKTKAGKECSDEQTAIGQTQPIWSFEPHPQR